MTMVMGLPLALGASGGGADLLAQVQALFGGGRRGALYSTASLGTLFQERTGAAATTPSAISGVVGTVLDLSGNGNHRVAPSDAARPILRQSGARHYLEYDAVDDCFQVPSFTISNRFYVGLAIKGAIIRAFFIEHSASANDFNGFYFHGSNAATWNVRRSAVSHFAAGVASWEGTTNAVCDLVYRTSSQNYAYNGVNGSNGTIISSLAALADVTATLNIMSRNAASLFSDTWEYGMVLLDGEVSDGEIAVMRQWLASLNGVAL